MIGREIHYGQGDQILNVMYKMHNEVILFMNDFSNERDMYVSLNYITIHEMSKKKKKKKHCSVAVLYDMHCYFSDISVICDNVTGSVEKEVNLTCSVSLLITDCCIIMYKFHYPESLNELVICSQSEYSCAQRNSFTCSYTPTTAMTQQFRFFLQTTCGAKTTQFTLNIPGLYIILQEDCRKTENCSSLYSQLQISCQ